MIKIFICLCCFIPCCFPTNEIKIKSLQIRGPFPEEGSCLKGCLYTTACCDCINAKTFTNSHHISFDTVEVVDLEIGHIQLNNTTGSTELEKKMFYDIGKICDDKPVCKFELHPGKYGSKYYISKAYEVQIEYTCTFNNIQSPRRRFTDTFEAPDYYAYISCIDSVETTHNKATFFDMTTNFKRVVFSAATAAVASVIKDHYFNEEFLSSFLKW